MSFFKRNIDLQVITNPFFVFPAAFGLAICGYILGWSSLYPKLSGSLIVFLIICSAIFVAAGILLRRKPGNSISEQIINPTRVLDLTFLLIIILGISDVVIMGYLPLFGRSNTYKEYGAPVVDVLFNTLSIFFSIVFLQTLIRTKKLRYLFYMIFILLFQVLLYRRSTIIWIVVASLFSLIHHYKKVNMWILIGSILLVPVLSYSFGLFGSTRSKLTPQFVIKEFKPDTVFQRSGLSYEHYMTYLYLTSPLANLQYNIQQGSDLNTMNDLKKFVFYCVMPPSVTMRLEKRLDLQVPEHKLINPNLIVGTCFMLSFCTLGWTGISIMAILILAYIWLAVYIAGKSGIFSVVSLSLIATAVSLAIFDNIFNRLDVIMILFIYPILFHFVFSRIGQSAKNISG